MTCIDCGQRGIGYGELCPVCGSIDVFGETDYWTWKTVVEDKEYQPPVELGGITVPRLTEIIKEGVEGIIFSD